jgi:hypothetical protein
MNGPVYVGDLHTYHININGHQVTAAGLLRFEDRQHALPPLYEPMLEGMATLAFRLRGFERVDAPDGPYTVLQEWHCDVP